MRLGEVDYIVNYFQKIRAQGHQRLGVKQPHKCQHCSGITIDGEACRDAWNQARAMSDPVNPSMTGSLQTNGFRPTAIRLHDTLSDVIHGAMDGCSFFEYLADLLVYQDESAEPFEGSDSYDLIFCLEPRVDRHGCIFTPLPYLMDENGQVFKSRRHEKNTLHVWTDDSNLASNYLDTRPIETDKASSLSMGFAQSNFQRCLSEHRVCRQSPVPDNQELPHEFIEASDLPARLLNIQQLPKELRVQLVETKNLPDTACHEICTGDYASLSYCWGADQPQKLTTKTYDQLKLGIDTKKLPKTLQDAIRIASSVGLKNIWIDAMCIIQDSTVDKEVEISRMPLYYGKNTLTISAASSKQCTEGILDCKANVNFKIGPFELPFHTKAGIGSIQLFAEDDQPTEPIDSRGWTFQESALSRRALVFASNQLRWHCLSGESRCGGPGAAFHELLSPDGADTSYSMALLYSNGLRLDNWNRIVQRYMSRKLTVESDKLLAISALADRMDSAKHHSLIGLTYVAGLFVVPDLIWTWINQLLWLSWPNMARPSTTYRAPTWSWASLDAEDGIHDLRFLFPPQRVIRKTRMFFEVQSFFVDLSLSFARYGSIKGAHIVVNGLFKRLRGDQTLKVTFPETIAPLARTAIRLPSQNELFLLPDTEDERAFMKSALEDGGEAMGLLELIPPFLQPGESRPGIGLVLKEDTAAGPDTFKRIGAFVVSYTCDENGWQDLESFFDMKILEGKII